MTNFTLSLKVGWVVDVAVRLPVRLAPIGVVARTVTTTLTLNLAPGARTGVSYVPALTSPVILAPVNFEALYQQRLAEQQQGESRIQLP